MSVNRVTHALAAGALTVALALTAWLAQAGATADAGSVHQHRAPASQRDHFVAPVPHRYGANGMRMGLHCEDKDTT